MLNQGDIIRYGVKSGLEPGTGKIVGKAVIEQPVIGASYIIEDLSGQIPNKEYPFTHFSMFEAYITKIGDSNDE